MFRLIYVHLLKIRSFTSFGRENINFYRNQVWVLIQVPVQGDRGKVVTSQVDCSIHSVCMDKPLWGPTNREKIFKILRIQNHMSETVVMQRIERFDVSY